MRRGPEAEFRLRAFHVIAVLAGCGTGVLAGCLAGVSAGCATGVPGAVGPAGSPALLPVFLLAVPPVFRAPSGPPARSPSAQRASLGASARSPARPRGPAGALHTGGSWCALPGHAHLAPVFVPRTAEYPSNFACNSLVTISNLVFAALELQRFLTWLNLRSIELHATFGGDLAVRRRPPHWWCVVRGAWCVVCGARPDPSTASGEASVSPALPLWAYRDRLCASG